MIVLKLGGSVITDKDREETVGEELLAALAGVLGGYEGDLVVVHGGGSFGHPAAAAHGVSRTDGTRSAEGVRGIHAAMNRLNDRVVDALADEGVPAVSVHPFSMAHRSQEGELSLPTEGIETILGEGFVPVLHGDVVPHRGEGATVVSGDELVVALAEGLDADGVGLCSTVPGVLDDTGNVIDEITSYDDVADYLGESESTDVTGGMAAKVQTLLELDAPASVFGPNDLDRFLANGSAGTRID